MYAYAYLSIYSYCKRGDEEVISSFYAKTGDPSQISTAFLTASTSMSFSFPVGDETIEHLFSCAFGTKRFPFSSEENNAMLQKATQRW